MWNINNNFNDNYLHLGLGFDWKLKWGSIVFGTTYTNGSNHFNSTSDPTMQNNNNQYIDLKYNRWQFIVGFEIPFLNDKLK